MADGHLGAPGHCALDLVKLVIKSGLEIAVTQLLYMEELIVRESLLSFRIAIPIHVPVGFS